MRELQAHDWLVCRHESQIPWLLVATPPKDGEGLSHYQEDRDTREECLQEFGLYQWHDRAHSSLGIEEDGVAISSIL